MYVLSFLNMSSVLKLRVFEGKKLSRYEEYDFGYHAFTNNEFNKLSDVLTYSEGFGNAVDVVRIDDNSPNSLDITSKENKLYCYSDKLVLSLDNTLSKTYLISIDLKDLTACMKFYNFAEVERGSSISLRSNSYLSNDVLYQLKVSKHELWFSAFDLNTEQQIKEYRVKKEEEISFKNSVLTQKRRRIRLCSQRTGTGQNKASTQKDDDRFGRD